MWAVEVLKTVCGWFSPKISAVRSVFHCSAETQTCKMNVSELCFLRPHLLFFLFHAHLSAYCQTCN